MAILFGTTGDGTTLPVLVDQFGNLLAKGIPGDEGPPGPPGGDFALPPDPVDGDVLGWENGQLVWVSEPLPPPASIFTPVIYSGNGGTQSITGVGFSPSLVWIKSMDDAYSHNLQDIIQGTGYYLSSNSTGAATAETRHITSFDSNGFTLGSGSWVNESAKDYIAWCWNAGDTTVTNNDGTIESQVRTNGNFSVVKYTGTGADGTLGLGLNNVPGMVIFKSLDQVADWAVYHSALAINENLWLNEPLVATTGQNFWRGIQPTSSVISINDSSYVNGAGDYVAYAWAETPGVSSFGEYDGNGSTTGPVIDCGFKPAFLLIKRVDSPSEWRLFDTARNPSNPADALLFPDTSEAEATNSSYNTNILANGFELKNIQGGLNASGGRYIYAAFR